MQHVTPAEHGLNEAGHRLAADLQCLEIARRRDREAGLDARQQIPVEPGYQVHFAAAIKAKVKMPVIAVGLITDPSQAESILRHGHADAVALARGILYDPRWPWHAAAALGDSLTPAPQYLRCEPREARGVFIAPSA